MPPASLLHRSGVKDLSAAFIADHSFSLNNRLRGIFFLSIFWLRLDTFVCFSLQDLQLAKSYDKEPTIMITANHDSKGNNLEPKYISVTAWIEVFFQFLLLFPVNYVLMCLMHFEDPFSQLNRNCDWCKFIPSLFFFENVNTRNSLGISF